jgi:hypothetical protein
MGRWLEKKRAYDKRADDMEPSARLSVPFDSIGILHYRAQRRRASSSVQPDGWRVNSRLKGFLANPAALQRDFNHPRMR